MGTCTAEAGKQAAVPGGQALSAATLECAKYLGVVLAEDKAMNVTCEGLKKSVPFSQAFVIHALYHKLFLRQKQVKQYQWHVYLVYL